MELSSSGIEGIIANSFFGISQLYGLFLGINDIKKLPDFIFKELNNLWKLDLRENDITEEGENAFPSSISNLELSLNPLFPLETITQIKSLKYIGLSGHRAHSQRPLILFKISYSKSAYLSD